MRQKTEERYFDTDEKPVLSTSGYAVISYEYDNDGNVITEQYYDESDKPIAVASGAHKVTRLFDEKKQKTERSLLTNQLLSHHSYSRRSSTHSLVRFQSSKSLPENSRLLQKYTIQIQRNLRNSASSSS